jgi:MYXO-CTERM domain-containing protein
MPYLSRALLLAVPCLAAALLAPGRADACSPAPPGLSASIPGNGESYPANAVLLFFGQQISLDAVTVNVIPPVGPTSALVPADVPFGLGSIAARIEQPPPPGHSVEIVGDFCPPEYMCEPQAITYYVASGDFTPPAAPTAVSFDVYDYPDWVSGGGDCTSDSDLGYWVHASVAPATSDEAPVVATITARENDTPNAVSTRSLVVTDGDLSVAFRLLVEQIAGEDPPEALCFDVTVTDTALNDAGSLNTICAPCRYRVDTDPMVPSFQPEEPAWTAADAYPGGPCKGEEGGGGSSGDGGGGAGAGGSDGGTGGGGGDDGVVGCACELERPARDAGTPLLLGALALGAARLRRRRRG